MSRRNLTACCLALVAVLLLAGCGINLQPDRDLTIQVTGTPGTAITGEYILTGADGTTRHTLEREVPFSIETSGHDLSCMLQKLGGDGTVRLQLLVNGERVAFAWTKDGYGNISADTP